MDLSDPLGFSESFECYCLRVHSHPLALCTCAARWSCQHDTACPVRAVFERWRGHNLRLWSAIRRRDAIEALAGSAAARLRSIDTADLPEGWAHEDADGSLWYFYRESGTAANGRTVIAGSGGGLWFRQ